MKEHTTHYAAAQATADAAHKMHTAIVNDLFVQCAKGTETKVKAALAWAFGEDPTAEKVQAWQEQGRLEVVQFVPEKTDYIVDGRLVLTVYKPEVEWYRVPDDALIHFRATVRTVEWWRLL